MKILMDLDDTLADCHHRVMRYIVCPERGRPHRQNPIDWDAFFRACSLDTPIPHMVSNFRYYVDQGYDVRIWTGRDEAVRGETLAWLEKYVHKEWAIHADSVRHMLVMRAIGDRTDDHFMKPGWMDKYDWRPDIVFEDRTRVVEAWRRAGVNCVQVAMGDF